MTELQRQIDKGRLSWESEHGRCSMCDVGGVPDEAGYHRYEGDTYKCGNIDPCGLCHGCLPPGEVCRGCHRMNPYQYEC